MGKKPSDPNAFIAKNPHTLSVEEAVNQYQTNLSDGLTISEAEKRGNMIGRNEIGDGGGGVSAWNVFVRQIANALILILVAAMALSYGVQDWVEGGVITFVIILNVFIGFFQEYRAEQTISSLKSLSSPTASVIRDSKQETVASISLVPGDIVILKTGDVIAADLRIFESSNLEVDEKILTGESMPVLKTTSKIDNPDTGVGDRTNLAYSSTIVTKGRGKGIAISTAMNTEIGTIAKNLGKEGKKKIPSREKILQKQGEVHINRVLLEMKVGKHVIKRRTRTIKDAVWRFLGLTEGTPLQIKLSKLAYVLFFCALILAIIVFAVAKFDVTKEVAVYAIALGISIIPESLVAVLTITFAVGTKRMAKQNALVRKLDALEALGGISDICSDKTGTLTQGKMVVKKIWLPPLGQYSVEGTDEAFEPKGDFYKGDIKSSPESKADKPLEKPDKPDPITSFDGNLAFLGKASAICNVASIRQKEENGKSRWLATGDPTEIALQVMAHKMELGRPTLVDEEGNEKSHNNRFRFLNEYPFDSTVKKMSVLVHDKEAKQHVLFSKGASERIIESCTDVVDSDDTSSSKPFDDQTKEEAKKIISSFARSGLRVLGIAYKNLKNVEGVPERNDVEKDLTLIGLVGIYDPPRKESLTAVRDCRAANIVVHMLTGDHQDTAAAIAKEVGILRNSSPEGAVMTAHEFDNMTDEQIDDLPELPLVIARCSPQTKVRMITAGERRGKYMAMTGDGVNDSPSLKIAPVGIAMGLAGSDVAKDASDIVLTDDNFASIVQAVREGRRLFDNISKFVLHLLATNVGEVILLMFGLAFQDVNNNSVFPISPLEILWVNMVTSSFPAFGLGLEDAEPQIMQRPPHDTKVGIFNVEVVLDTLIYGTWMGILNLIIFIVVIYGRYDGNLGENCNQTFSEACIPVFRARATIFSALIFQILILAWEIKSLKRSMFRLDPTSKNPIAPLWKNKFLFWSVIIGSLLSFPCIYIDTINTKVFKHAPISWEWGLSFGTTVVFVLGVEAWKYIKRWRNLELGNKSLNLNVSKSLSFSRSFTKDRTIEKPSRRATSEVTREKPNGISSAEKPNGNIV